MTDDRKSADGETESSEIDFVTLGMFILGISDQVGAIYAVWPWHQKLTLRFISTADEIEYLPPKPPVRDVLGGAGAYAALGARLCSPPPFSRAIGWIVDQGTDFPSALTDVINSWDTNAILRPNPNRLTTRGWNGYVDASERRAFRYTTPKRRLAVDDLTAYPSLLQSKSVHIICSPARCRELVTSLFDLRKEAADADNVEYTRPFIIWEPVPDRCVPEELLNCTNTLPLVDVCSPNHAELAGFMGSDGLDPATGAISTAAVEQACEQLLASMPLQSYALVVRAGEKGCYVAKNGGRKRCSGAQRGTQCKSKHKKSYARAGLQLDTDMEALFAGLLQDEEGMVVREEIELDPGVERWIPACHSNNPSMVVDPTGGGNTFLGGMAVALARGQTLEEACVWGSVAASFAIEQVGVPQLGLDDAGYETWNGVRFTDRLKEFQSRL